MNAQELSKIHVNADGDLVYISTNLLDPSAELQTHIQGFLYEDMWWFYIKNK